MEWKAKFIAIFLKKEGIIFLKNSKSECLEPGSANSQFLLPLDGVSLIHAFITKHCPWS